MIRIMFGKGQSGWEKKNYDKQVHTGFVLVQIQTLLPGLIPPRSQKRDFHECLISAEKKIYSPISALGSIGVRIGDLDEIERFDSA